MIGCGLKISFKEHGIYLATSIEREKLNYNLIVSLVHLVSDRKLIFAWIC
jgi:hypothetical protein